MKTAYEFSKEIMQKVKQVTLKLKLEMESILYLEIIEKYL